MTNATKFKKQKIPATLRNTVWNTYIGSDMKTGLCFCCQSENISFANFECGHVNSEKSGGELTMDNLRRRTNSTLRGSSPNFRRDQFAECAINPWRRKIWKCL